MELIRKVRDLIIAIRANDWVSGIRLVGEIIAIITDGMASQPPPVPQAARSPMPTRSAALATAEAMDECALADELEQLCDQHAPAGAVATTAQGPFIDMLTPLILALLKKLLGF